MQRMARDLAEIDEITAVAGLPPADGR